MRKCTWALALLLVMMLLAACGEEKKTETPSAAPTTADRAVTTGTDETTAPTTDASVTTEPESTPTPEATPTPELTEEEKWYNSMIQDSLMTTGNNVRLKNVIEKARAGEEVYIAAIGGSITEGEGAKPYENCYAYQTYEAFAEMFGTGDNVHFINAGVSGTPSSLGVIRYQRDVVDKLSGIEPDLVIVEFAVNDADDLTNGKAYEGLVRHILKQENDPAVVLLFSVFQSQWNLQDRCSKVGAFYGLPMVSIKNAVVDRLNDGSLTNAQFFNDIYHPTTYGHAIMKDCLKYLFETVDAEEKMADDITVGEYFWYSDIYDNVQMIDNTNTEIVTSVGSFTGTDKNIGSVRYDNTQTFPLNWSRAAGSDNEAFTMKLTCKALLMTYKSTGSAGIVEVYVDGELVKSVDGSQGGGWNNPYTVVVLENKKSAEHTIEIKMAEGSVDKMFTLMTFGYAE